MVLLHESCMLHFVLLIQNTKQIYWFNFILAAIWGNVGRCMLTSNFFGLQNRLISAGLEPSLSQTEKSCIASYLHTISRKIN